MNKLIITKAERCNNRLVIETCRHGLHFVYVHYKTTNGGGGYASLVHNGRTVDYNGRPGVTLEELDAKNRILLLGDDIPDTFKPRDLIQEIMFNEWKG